MNKWLFTFAPLLLFLLVPVDVQAERLLLTGSGELQKRIGINISEFEVVFESIPNELRTILEFESGFITINNEQHFILPHSEIRDFMNHQIIRISGVLDDGNLFWIYGLKDESNYEMFGKIVTPENKFTIQYDGNISSLDLPIPEVKSQPRQTLEDIPILGIDFMVEDVQFIQNDLEVMVTAFDTRKAIGGIGNTLNNISGVDVKVDLAQERVEHVFVNERTVYPKVVEDDWQHIVSFEGKTNQFGKWTGAQLLGSKIFQQNQWLQVTITATYGEQSLTEQVEVFVSDAN